MIFIFPKNYTFKSKLFGFIDYSTAILDAAIAFLIYFFVNLFITSTTIKIYIFISTFFPFFLISVIGINKESFISVFKYMFKFIKNQNVYLYNKKN